MSDFARVHRFALALPALAGVALSAVGCHRSSSVFSPAGPSARAIGSLGTGLLVTFGLVSVVMFVLIVAGALRRSGTLDEHAPVDAGGGQRWILVGGFLVPGVVLGVFFVLTLRTIDRFPLHEGGHARPDIRLVGRQWWWEVQYLGDGPATQMTTANEIHVPLGWPVEIELVSRDVIHSFWVPALHGKVDLIPGQTNRIRIEADSPGRFDGQCAEYCGAEHTLMSFSVVAEPLDDYERWLANEAAPAVTPTDAEGLAGKRLFESHACGLCHTVRGTAARAAVGPDLTHVASRRGIAAYSLPNSRAYLEAWITHAQSFKPGSEMPNLAQFDGEELQALARYLEELR
jgi:cytochrome c oxidase subunit 2